MTSSLRGPIPSLHSLILFSAFSLAFELAAQLPAQTPAATPSAPATVASPGPLAIVPLDDKTPGSGETVTGALEVTGGRAIIAASGTITSGSATTEVLLPHRGTLRVCASTTVKLAAGSSVAAGDTPGLMMAIDHGAVEASFATGRNADILLTPDFRILIGGPGAADVKVRLGDNGDTCVDNPGVPGANAPYVLVTSVFDNSDYRVQPGQRVMFQHGSLHEVVDQEKEPCGCPAPPKPDTNDFPMAQSAGLAPLPVHVPAAPNQNSAPTLVGEPLVYKSAAPTPAEVASPAPTSSSEATPPAAPPAKPPVAKKPGLFGRIGRFFRRIFGAD
jgi:hypothetical protein